MKNRLREQSLKYLNSLPIVDRKIKSEAISKNLFELLSKLNIPENLIGGFSPIQAEPLWFLALDGELYDYALPGLEESFIMNFFKVNFRKLVSLEYGYSFSGSEKVFPKVLIVPGLAFGFKGERLGRGKGFYDRYLQDKSIIKVGVCFEGQLLEDIKMNSNDIFMDFIVTDKSILKG